MSRPRLSVDGFMAVAEGAPREFRPDLFDLLSEELQEQFWRSLAEECAEHRDRQRLADPDEVEWHRRSRVGRLWDVPKYARRAPRFGTSVGDAGRDDVLRTIEPRVYVEMLTGVAVPLFGVICCPLPGHEDRTPSFKIYESEERGWFCFGCHRGGTIYDFAAELWGMDVRRRFSELRRLLATEMLGRCAA